MNQQPGVGSESTQSAAGSTPPATNAPQSSVTSAQPVASASASQGFNAESGVKLSSEDKVFASLAYVSILFVVPLILRHDEPTVHFHAKQGMLVFAAEVVVWFVLFILESFVTALSPSNTLGIVSALGGLAWLLFVAVSLISIYFIFRDKKWKIPFLSRFADKVRV